MVEQCGGEKTRATKQQFAAAAVLAFKVNIEKSRGEMSLLGQDTIENFS